MTVKLLLLAIALACFSFAAESVSHDLDALRAMTTWNVSQPKWPAPASMSCGINIASYERRRMDHEIGSDVANERATRQIQLLDRRITSYLKRHQWSAMDVGNGNGEIPNTKRCYMKGRTIVQIYQTTGRCTMNTPCIAFDGFAITVYMPRTMN